MDDKAERRRLERTQDFIPLTRTLARLKSRLPGGTSIDEIAAWVWLAPPSLEFGEEAELPPAKDNERPPREARKVSELRAYRGSFKELNSNGEEIASFSRFYFDPNDDPESFDFVASLLDCFFRTAEVDDFQPAERFISGRDLLKRWGAVLGGPQTFIAAQVRLSRLSDLHPLFGGTCLSADAGQVYPPIEAGLFSVAEIEAIEGYEAIVAPSQGVGTNPADLPSVAATDRAVSSEQHPTVRHQFVERSNPLKALIAAAQEAAVSAQDTDSVWLVMVEWARRSDRPAPLVAYVEDESAIKWTKDDGEIQFLSKGSLRKRLSRQKGRSRLTRPLGDPPTTANAR